MESSDLINLSSLHITSAADIQDPELASSYDEDELGVLLSFAEKPNNPRSVLRHHFPSKAGGTPAWLDPANLPGEKSRSCGICGEPLQFLLQCSVVSVVMERRESVAVAGEPATALRNQALHWRSEHKSECRQIISSSEAPVSTLGGGRENLPIDNKVACHTLWPEYEIVLEDEWVSDSEVTEDNSSATSLTCKQDEQDEVFEALNDKFEADDDKKVWASFQERIAKAPNQVLRYYRDPMAKPLWALSIGQPSKADVPKCNYCKGPLC